MRPGDPGSETGKRGAPYDAATGATSTLTVTPETTLSASELAYAANMLVHTYDDSPLFKQAFPDPARRNKASRAIFSAVLRDGLRFGYVVIARNPEIVGAGVWYAPGAYPPSLARKVRLLPQYLQAAVADFGGLLKAMQAESTLEHLHPSEPHVYGYFLGVARGKQGAGVGRAIMRYALDHTDAARMPFYLETQEQSNADWYQRLGFRIVHEGLEMYPGGPLTWTMWRDAPR